MFSKSEHEKILAQIDAAGGGVNVSKYEFYQIPKWLARVPLKELGQSEKMLYGVIKSLQAINGRYCYPAVSTLADSIGATKETVNRLTRNLIKAGLLGRISRKRPDGSYMTSIYWVKEREDWIKDWEVVNGKNIPDDPSSDDTTPVKNDSRGHIIQDSRGSVTDDNRIEEVENIKKEKETVHPTTYERTEQIGGKEQTAQPVCSVPSKERRTAQSLSTGKSKAKARSVQILKNHGVDFEHLNAGLDAGASPMAQMVSLYCEKSGANNGIAHLFRISPEKLNEVLCFLDGFIRECAGDPDNPVDYFHYAFAGDYNGKVPETLYQATLFARRIKEGKTEKDGKIYNICPGTGRIISQGEVDATMDWPASADATIRISHQSKHSFESLSNLFPGGGEMGTLRFVNQWARTPKPNNPEISAQKTLMLAQVVDVERRKDRALRRRSRELDRSGCYQSEFGFLRSVVCDGEN